MVIFSTIGGTTRKVAQRVATRIGDGTVVDARSAFDHAPGKGERCLLLFCPTYGDGEADDDFEQLLLECDWSIFKGTPFAFGELGIYTGYEDFGHGLAPIVQRILQQHGLHELVPPLSIDAVPITDWNMVDAWADLIVARLRTRE